jgi:hypothetical protein
MDKMSRMPFQPKNLVGILNNRQPKSGNWPDNPQLTKFADPYHLAGQIDWMDQHSSPFEDQVALLEKHVNINRMTEDEQVLPVADVAVWNKLIVLQVSSSKRAWHVYEKMVHHGHKHPTIAPNSLTYFILLNCICKNLDSPASIHKPETWSDLYIKATQLMASMSWETIRQHRFTNSESSDMVKSQSPGSLGEELKVKMDASHLHLYLRILTQTHLWHKATAVYHYILARQGLPPWIAWIVHDWEIMQQWRPWTRSQWKRAFWDAVKSEEAHGSLVDEAEMFPTESTFREGLDSDELDLLNAIEQESVGPEDPGDLTFVYTHLFRGLSTWSEEKQRTIFMIEQSRQSAPPNPNPALPFQKRQFEKMDPLQLLVEFYHHLEKRQVKIDTILLTNMLRAQRRLADLRHISKPSQRKEMWSRIDVLLGISNQGSTLPDWISTESIYPHSFSCSGSVLLDGHLAGAICRLATAVHSPSRGLAMIVAMDPHLQTLDQVAMDDFVKCAAVAWSPRPRTDKYKHGLSGRDAMTYMNRLTLQFSDRISARGWAHALDIVHDQALHFRAKWPVWNVKAKQAFPAGIPEALTMIDNCEKTVLAGKPFKPHAKLANAWLALLPPLQLVQDDVSSETREKFIMTEPFLQRFLRIGQVIQNRNALPPHVAESLLIDLDHARLLSTLQLAVKYHDTLEDEDVIDENSSVDELRAKLSSWPIAIKPLPSIPDRPAQPPQKRFEKTEFYEFNRSLTPKLWTRHPSNIQRIEANHYAATYKSKRRDIRQKE